ncbi:MAG: hypothetical protein M9894_23665 [Planctomycetes bacterium]|nr:hypothetical protein [Planctomycetota bacterium]
MRAHIQIVGFLHVIYNLLGVLTGLAFIAVWVMASGAVSAAAAGQGEVAGGVAAGGVLAAVGIFIGCLVLLPSLPGFIGGVACLQHRPWARLVLIIVSGLHILTLVPTSVVLGGYSLYVLLSAETKAIFEGYDWIPKDPQV